MSARNFSKVSPSLWRSLRFQALSDRNQKTFLYFITNSHIDSSGVYHLPDLYACSSSDLNMDLVEYGAARAACIEAGMIDYDPEHSVILIERWFKHNPPTSHDYATGVLRRIAKVESERLRVKALAAFEPEHEAMCVRLAEMEEAKAARKAAGSVKALIGVSPKLLNSPMVSGGRG
jgi:hypothetical protein